MGYCKLHGSFHSKICDGLYREVDRSFHSWSRLISLTPNFPAGNRWSHPLGRSSKRTQYFVTFLTVLSAMTLLISWSLARMSPTCATVLANLSTSDGLVPDDQGRSRCEYLYQCDPPPLSHPQDHFLSGAVWAIHVSSSIKLGMSTVLTS